MTVPPPAHQRIRPLSRAEVRGLDVQAAEEIGLPTLVLMENAGRGAAEIVFRRTGPTARIVIVCGPGNNGGDGAVAARHLDAWGCAVKVVWLADRARLQGAPAAHWDVLDRSGIDQICSAGAQGVASRLADADWAVDGLFGTGLSRPVDGAMRRAIETLNDSGKPILALDLPSGLDCDSGRPLGAAVRAVATASFVAPKIGFAAPGAAEFTGAVEIVDVGFPRRLLERFSAAAEVEPPADPL